MDVLGWAARRVAKSLRGVKLKGRGLERIKKLESMKIKLYDRMISRKLQGIYKNFPNVDSLPTYVRAMLDARVGISRLKRSLGKIRAILNVLASIRDSALYEIWRARSREEVIRARKRYVARVSDVLEDIREDMEVVERGRRGLKIPVDPEKPTVVIAGFPNAGKSTLLKALTGSEPEIAPYPFTTKRILLGHYTYKHRPIQVVDTPGILDRPVDKMKREEKEALASIKYLAHVVVFLLDPFQDRASQHHLLSSLKAMLPKPFIVALGKADLLEAPEEAARAWGALPISPLTGYNIETLREKINKEVEGIKWW